MNITIEKIDEFKNKVEDLIREYKAPEGKSGRIQIPYRIIQIRR